MKNKYYINKNIKKQNKINLIYLMFLNRKKFILLCSIIFLLFLLSI